MMYRSAGVASVRVAPTFLFAEFTRRDDAERIVEGYCYVNAEVPGDSIDLTRAAMEAATEDYMRWANIREMHQNWAAGVVVGLEWDERGCKITARVSDDAAWQKVLDGVYKGFSVGWRTNKLQGRKAIDVTWIETSLVDRPADPDAVFTAARSENLELQPDYEAEVIPELEAEATEPDPDPEATENPEPVEVPNPLERVSGGEYGRALASFREYMQVNEEYVLIDRAMEILMYLLWEISSSSEWSEAAGLDAAARDAAARQAIAEFTEYVVPHIVSRATQRAEAAPNTRGAGDVDAARMQTTVTELTQRALTAETDLASARGQISNLRAQVQQARRGLPVRYPQAHERTFAANNGAAGTSDVTALRAEYKAVTDAARTEPDQHKRNAAVQKMQVIKMKLAEFGESV